MKSPAVDAYIAKAAEFARPLLRHLRAQVHATCPEVEERLKWSMPFFLWQGNLCHMAAFKAHCAFGFWHKDMAKALGRSGTRSDEAMGAFGRIEKLADLPTDAELRRLVKAAMKLNASGAPAMTLRRKRPELPVPVDLAKALKANAAAAITFRNFAPSHRREYITWLTEAKRPETRAKRLADTLKWLAAGKPRNWKYLDC
ncbi:MAG: YdeI/OmpD-associated family protein [Opitutaceae bacterium]|nr:YdeI/OmpD-associated family protein [Opitutaceae bacterium]MBP9912565.1 YdeI/OmpD-associated family protein [Opitutaceae bacterium]